MKIWGFRGQLFFASLVVLGGIFFALEYYLSHSIPSHIKNRLVRDLGREAALVAAEARALPSQEPALADALADRLAGPLGVRVTLLDPAGRVLGDSAVPLPDLADLAPHNDRPEIQAALSVGLGVATRDSATINEPLLYVAVPYPEGGARGVARVALPLSDSEQELASSRWVLALGTAVAALCALGFATAAAHLLSRSIRALTPVARAIAEGDFSRRAPARGHDEVSELGRALNRLATDLEKSMGAVRAERDLLDAVLDGMEEGVLVLDHIGRIARTNAALRAWLELPQEPANKLPFEIWPDLVLDQALFEARVKAQAQELNLTRAERSLLVHVTPLSLTAGGGAVAVFYDVTELRRLERVRRDFVTNVSHELRTPVSAIRGAAETLLDGGLDSQEDGLRFASVIWRHANRLASILSDLLELSRIESSGARLDKDTVDMIECAHEALEAQEERLEARHLLTNVDLPEGLPRAAGDRRAVARVLNNLLENAINYTEPQGTISLRASVTDAFVVVEVSDTGVGIEARHLPRIFERFYRADAGRSRAQGGTGLGLSIVRHLVQGMNGEISVESEPGKGSTFRVRLKRFPTGEKLASPP